MLHAGRDQGTADDDFAQNKAGLGTAVSQAVNILLQHRLSAMREQASEALTSAGFAVHCCEDGFDGLAYLISHAPDVVITGISMPRLDGLGFIEAVRQLDHLWSTPILVMSTCNTSELKTRARNVGASGWLPYPLDMRRLADTVRAVACK